MAGLGQSLKKALFVLVVLLACSTKPVRGFPFEWWRVRVWEGKFYYIYRSGYWQELMEWETEEMKPEEAAEVPDVPMEDGPPEDAAMPERGRSRRPSLNRGRMGPRSLTPAMGRGTPAQPGVQGSFLKPEVQEEEEECEEEEEEQDDEMAKPVKAEGQKKTNKRKKRKKPAKAEVEEQEKPQDNQKDPDGGDGGGPSPPPEEPPLPPPPFEPDFSAS